MPTKVTAMQKLQRLAEDFAEIAQEADTASVDQAGAIRAPMAALLAVTQFLDTFQPFLGDGPGRGLTKPLWDLLVAMVSVSDGIAHPLLTPPKMGKRSKSVEQQAMMGWAAVAFDCLQNAGLNRQQAGEKVAAELTEVRINRGVELGKDAPTGKTVEGWINKVRQGDGSAPPATMVIWRKYVQGKRTAEDQTALAEWALAMLRQLVSRRLIIQIPPAKVEY